MKETGLTGKRRSTTIAATPDDGNSQRKRRRYGEKEKGVTSRQIEEKSTPHPISIQNYVLTVDEPVSGIEVFLGNNNTQN